MSAGKVFPVESDKSVPELPHGRREQIVAGCLLTSTGVHTQIQINLSKCFIDEVVFKIS